MRKGLYASHKNLPDKDAARERGKEAPRWISGMCVIEAPDLTTPGAPVTKVYGLTEEAARAELARLRKEAQTRYESKTPDGRRRCPEKQLDLWAD